MTGGSAPAAAAAAAAGCLPASGAGWAGEEGSAASAEEERRPGPRALPKPRAATATPKRRWHPAGPASSPAVLRCCCEEGAWLTARYGRERVPERVPRA